MVPLTAREAARLRGLPDGYSFAGQADKATFKQIGNGVNTGVMWNVLKAHCARDLHPLTETVQRRAIAEAVEGSPDNPRELLGGLFACSSLHRMLQRSPSEHWMTAAPRSGVQVRAMGATRL